MTVLSCIPWYIFGQKRQFTPAIRTSTKLCHLCTRIIANNINIYYHLGSKLPKTYAVIYFDHPIYTGGIRIIADRRRNPCAADWSKESKYPIRNRNTDPWGKENKGMNPTVQTRKSPNRDTKWREIDRACQLEYAIHNIGTHSGTRTEDC